MLLAEALAAKKDALKEVNDLRERLAAAAVRYEDQESATEDPTELVAKVDDALDRVESLTVRIKRRTTRRRWPSMGAICRSWRPLRSAIG